MSVSDEECREVAARLAREAQAWSDTFPDEICYLGDASAVMQDLCVFVGLRGKVTCGCIFLRFAELIDRPTCRNVYDETECGCCENGFECSECGNRVEDIEHYRITGTFNYCPKCGREVVRE